MFFIVTYKDKYVKDGTKYFINVVSLYLSIFIQFR